MEEKTLLAFAKWMQSKDEKLAKVPVEQLAAKVVEAMKTQEGQKQLAPLFQQFQSEVSEIMRSGGKMDYAVKKMSEGSAISESAEYYDENGNKWSSREDYLNDDRKKNPLKYSPVVPALGHPLNSSREFIDYDAAVAGEYSDRIQNQNGSITDSFGRNYGHVIAPKPEVKFSGNDVITRTIVDWDGDGVRQKDTIYTINRVLPMGYDFRHGRASDESVSKYRNRVNSGWGWKRKL